METICVSQQNVRSCQKQVKPTVMALGNFDGLHIGHCQVIHTAGAIAKQYGLPLSVMSFTPHPRMVLSIQKEKFHELMPLCDKEEKLKTLGVDRLYLVKFDLELAMLPPEQFAQQFLVNLGVVHAVAGFDFTYGFRGEGNIDRLRQDSAGQIQVTNVPKIAYNEEKISSSSIRNRLLAGNVQELPHFLGHYYTVKCIWNGYSFQLQPHYTAPGPGVYEVKLIHGNEEFAGRINAADDGTLECLEPIPAPINGMLTIVWKNRVEALVV